MVTKETTVDLAAILAVLQEVKAGQDTLGARLEAVEKRVETQDAAIPQMRPMDTYTPWDDGSPNDVFARIGRNGQIEGSFSSIPHDDYGRPLAETTLLGHPPRYHVGQAVRINLDAVHYGMPEGMTYAKRLAQTKTPPPGPGKVTQILHQLRRGPWVYRIKIDRIGGVNGWLALDDDELLPA